MQEKNKNILKEDFSYTVVSMRSQVDKKWGYRFYKYTSKFKPGNR